MPAKSTQIRKRPVNLTLNVALVAQAKSYTSNLSATMVPLVRRSALPGNTAILASRMNPTFSINGTDVVLHPLDMVSVAVDQLGDYIGSLADQGQTITDALDELLTRSWG